MSEDEVLVLAVSAVAAALSWGIWLFQLMKVRCRLRGGGERLWLWGTPVVAAAITLGVLLFYSAEDVRHDGKYLLFYLVFVAAWVGMARLLIPLFGISLRDDILERGNTAATPVYFGAIQGLTLSIAGGNIGDGPGWWVVVYAGGLATACLLLAWGLYEWLTGISEAVTVDRDRAGGLRLACWLIAVGLISGAAVAGDWESVAATHVDFLDRGWPVLVLLISAWFIERIAQPTPERPEPGLLVYGMAPGLGYLTLAILWVVLMGLEA